MPKIEPICYFEDKGKWRENTRRVVEIVKDCVKRDRIKHVVVASCTGYTAAQFAQALDLSRVNLVGVKMAQAVDTKYGIKVGPKWKKILDQKGVPLIGGTHVLTGGIDHALVEEFKALPHGTLVANVFYLFSQGMKVAPEVLAMAVDAGLVPEGKKAIAVGGTDSGADTAIVVKAASSTNFFTLEIQKILCMPLEK